MADYIPTVIQECLTTAICTRNQNWDNDEFERGFVQPYRKIEEMKKNLEEEGKEPTKEHMIQALDMLKGCFKTKKVPLAEQLESFNRIFERTNKREFFADYELPIEEPQ